MSNQVRKKVYVGVSGGVDSSVTTALLKERGFDVTGVFIKAWHPEGFPCSWREDRRDAMRVCAVLDIPFKTLDLEKEYKQSVVNYMISEYEKGRTPNPDVMCNKYVKFGGFMNFALKEGADFIATGHYARKINGNLAEAKDKAKDQSYFLWTLTQDQLKRVLFPIGEYQKKEVRKLAEKFELPTATKKDSQGLCFIGKVDIKDFLIDNILTKKGDVLNEDGEIIGFHKGSHLYTIGERHGFTVNKKTTENKPVYIINKDIIKNTITVCQRKNSERKNKDLSNNKILKVELGQVNWIQKIEFKKKYSARFRYHQNPIWCYIKIENEKFIVYFEEPQSGIAFGQSLVIYDGFMCLGGGIMEK